MITMEFDEMKKLWGSQEVPYDINEKVLHEHILSKKRQAFHITNISELIWIITNVGGGLLVLGLNLFKQSENIFMYLLSVWMIGSALYVLVNRIRRIRGSNQFDRSMNGDLKNAISMATYQVRFSQLGRWSILPIGILVSLGILEGGKSLWMLVAIIVLLVLTNYAAGFEHNFYKDRKHELEMLQSKLENEETR
jgi:hypothetical protein